MNILSPCAQKGRSGFTWIGRHLLKEGATSVKPPGMARYGSGEWFHPNGGAFHRYCEGVNR